MRAVLWNINKQKHAELLDTLINQTSADVAVIVECPKSMSIPSGYARLTTSHSSLRVISRRGAARLVAEDPSRRFAAVTHHETGTLLVGCHLPSKLHRTEDDAIAAALRLREFIESVETAVGHERTAVLGDMNMDPYESGMVHCDGLHAVMSKSVAQRGTRVVQSETRRFFYNPMWSKYGDIGATAPATYFYQSSSARAYFWHMFDQVLLRPSLISSLRHLEIIEMIGSTSIVDSQQRPHTKFSDHLPVSVELSDLTPRTSYVETRT